MILPVEWIKAVLSSVAVFGILLGILSAASPKRSIELYQKMMQKFNWRVEPIHYERELRNTRVLGTLMLLTSVGIVIALLEPWLLAW